MSRFSDFSGGGISSGVSFDGMPLYGDTSGGKSSSYVTYNYMILKGSSFLYYIRSSTQFFNYLTLGYNSGVVIATATAANTWYTIVSTTGTKGKLFNVIPPMGTGVTSIDIEVTIDGLTHLYSFVPNSTGRTGYLGQCINTGTVPHITPTFDWHETQVLPNSYGDTGFQPSPYSAFQPPRKALELGFPYLQWTNDMQIRVRLSTTADTPHLGHYAGAIFMYD